MLKKAIAEFIGTFVLVLFGTGVAVKWFRNSWFIWSIFS